MDSSHWAAADLVVDDFRLSLGKDWASPARTASYPIAWKLTIPKLNLDLDITTAVEDQELNLAVTYWEGCIRVKGRRAGKPVDGVGQWN